MLPTMNPNPTSPEAPMFPRRFRSVTLAALALVALSGFGLAVGSFAALDTHCLVTTWSDWKPHEAGPSAAAKTSKASTGSSTVRART